MTFLLYAALLHLAFGLIVSATLFSFDKETRSGNYIVGYMIATVFWPLVLLVWLADLLGFLGE